VKLKASTQELKHHRLCIHHAPARDHTVHSPRYELSVAEDRPGNPTTAATTLGYCATERSREKQLGGCADWDRGVERQSACETIASP
jgi:hypothetical protein